jgi:hypothetical protein
VDVVLRVLGLGLSAEHRITLFDGMRSALSRDGGPGQKVDAHGLPLFIPPSISGLSLPTLNLTMGNVVVRAEPGAAISTTVSLGIDEVHVMEAEAQGLSLAPGLLISSLLWQHSFGLDADSDRLP